MDEMSPLSEVPANQLPRGKTPGDEYLVPENAKPTAHPLKGENAAMPQPRIGGLSSNGNENGQRQCGQRHQFLTYRRRPTPVRLQPMRSFSNIRFYNSSVPSIRAGASPLNHYRTLPFQGLEQSMSSDHGSAKRSPSHVSSRRLDGPNTSGPAYPSGSARQGLLRPNHQPAVDWQGDIPACKKLDYDDYNEGQLIEPAFRCSLSPRTVLSSDDDAPNQLVSRLPSPKPAIQTSVSYYDYSEPFHEVTATTNCKPPVAYSGPPKISQRACHAPKPGRNQVVHKPNDTSRQIRWPLKNQLVGVVDDTEWNRSNLRRGNIASHSHAERGLGSSLPCTFFQRRHYISQSYRPNSNLETPGCSAEERRLSMASPRLGFSFPIPPTNSITLSDDTHGLGLNILSSCSVPLQTSLLSMPTRSSENQWTENAFPPRTCPDQTMELLDGLLAQKSQLTKEQLCTDFQATTVAKFQNVERPVRMGSINNAVASVLNGNYFSRSVLESEHETKPTADIYEGLSVLDDSPSKASGRTPVRKLQKNASRYREKGTQTSPSTSRSETPIGIVKGTNRTLGESTQKDHGQNYSEVQPNTLGENCEVTLRLLAALEAEKEKSLPLRDSNILRQSPEISSHLPRMTGMDACQNKEILSSTDPPRPVDIDSISKQTATPMLQLTPKEPLAVMELDQGPGPSIREPSLENPNSNHHIDEAFIRPRELRKLSRSHQPESPNTKFGFSGHFSQKRDKSNTDATRMSQLDSTSHGRSAGMEKRLKLPKRTRYSRPERSIQDESSEISSRAESRQSDPASPFPTRDSIETPDIRSIFSDDSSFQPRKGLKKRIIRLAAKLPDPRASLKWFTHNSQRNSRRSSETTDGGNDAKRRSSSVNKAGDTKRQSIKRRSISKTKDLWRRCSLYERSLGHKPQVLRNTY